MEIKYVKCIISKASDFTIGKIYNWPNPVDDRGTVRRIGSLNGSLWSFEPSTEKAYNAQIKTTDYIPKIGDYVIMENAGGWGYHPANNGCLAVITAVSTKGISGIKKDFTVYSISGTLINSITSLPVKFTDIPQLDSSEKIVFRQALPHEISNTTPKTEPQQVEEWAEKTYAVGVKGNFGVYQNSDNPVPVGKIFTITKSKDRKDSVIIAESQFWIYKKNLRWAATYREAEIISKQILDQAFCENPAKITSPTEAISDESPLDICRKRYKKGMKVRSAQQFGKYSGEFYIGVDPSRFCHTGDGVDYFGSEGWLYLNGKFADILENPKEPVLPRSVEIDTEMDKVSIINKLRPETADLIMPSFIPSDAVKNIQKQIKKNKFQEVHEIKTVEEKLLKKTKSKLFNI